MRKSNLDWQEPESQRKLKEAKKRAERDAMDLKRERQIKIGNLRKGKYKMRGEV